MSAVTIFRCKIRALCKQISEFERGHLIGLKILNELSQSDAAIRRCWQEWVNNGRYQGQNSSSRPRSHSRTGRQSSYHSTGFIAINYPPCDLQKCVPHDPRHMTEKAEFIAHADRCNVYLSRLYTVKSD